VERVTFDDLRDEYERAVIGPLIQEVVQDVCRLVAGKYPPGRYTGRSGASEWNSDDFSGLSQEVLVWLFKSEQLEWIFSQVSTVGDFRGLIGLQVKRTLGRRLERTCIDNLRQRAKDLLDEPPFEQVSGGLGNATKYSRVGMPTPTPHRAPTSFGEAVRRVALVPKLRSHAAQERNPRVYNEGGLRACLEAMAAVYPDGFTLKEFEEVLEKVLPDYVVADLVSIDGTDREDPDREEGARGVNRGEDAGFKPSATGLDSVGGQVAMDEMAEQIFSGLSEEERGVMRRKVNGMSDTGVAEYLGCSRPIAARTWKSIRQRINAVLSDLEEDERERLASELSRLLVVSPPGEDNDGG
jgi:hypothetical protein